jgi:hypothetical protein
MFHYNMRLISMQSSKSMVKSSQSLKIQRDWLQLNETTASSWVELIAQYYIQIIYLTYTCLELVFFFSLLNLSLMVDARRIIDRALSSSSKSHIPSFRVWHCCSNSM